ncbi:MAG: hypothetical protein U9P44_02730 [archaeon]|nr:hypothetical protein [archaeon]
MLGMAKVLGKKDVDRNSSEARFLFDLVKLGALQEAPGYVPRKSVKR